VADKLVEEVVAHDIGRLLGWFLFRSPDDERKSTGASGGVACW
jgi:hypothetical protein